MSDDDTTGPEILININGFYLNPSGGVDVKFEIIATDPESGIDFSSIDIVALNQHFTSLGSFTATVQELITYTITAHIKNADLDRGSIDQELAIATLDVNVTGDLLKTLILAGIEDLSILVENSNDMSWRSPGANRKNTIETKLEDLVALINSNQYNGTYCKLLHDLKPKLTGLKHDEFGATWGSGTSNTPWVVDVPLQGDFESTINALLHALRWLAGGDPNPIGRLLASALTKIEDAQETIATIGNCLIRGILEWSTNRVRINLQKGWDLYGADLPDWAAIRIKVADCMLKLSDAVVDIGGLFGVIDEASVTNLDDDFTIAHASLAAVLSLLNTMAEL